MRTLEEARVISDRDRDLLGQLRRLIQQHLPGATVLLYGSVARGTQGPESDYDMLILTDGPISDEQEDAVRATLYPLELDLGVVVSKMFYSREEWDRHPAMPFHIEVERDAVII